MRFTKMQGAGNDYVYVDCFAEPMPQRPGRTGPPNRRPPFRRRRRRPDPDLPQPAGRRPDADVQRRRLRGGNVRQRRPLRGQVRLRSWALPQKTLRIETGRGVLTLELEVRTAMVAARPRRHGRADPRCPSGSPRPCPAIPARRDGAVGRRPAGQSATGALRVTCVSMGNPHCVTFVDAADRPTGCWDSGRRSRRDPHFPKRVNAEFVEVISPDEVRDARSGSAARGETLACGTGACAVCVAGVLTGRTRAEDPRPSARRRPGAPLGRRQSRLHDRPGRRSLSRRLGRSGLMGRP